MQKKCKLSCLLFSIFLVVSTGCAKHDTYITIGEWLKRMCEEGGIPPSSSSLVMIGDVQENDPYYQAANDAADFGIIAYEDDIAFTQPLTNEIAAYTMCNLLQEDEQEFIVKGIENSQYRKQIMTAAALRLLKVKHGHIDPKAYIRAEEAESMLDTCIQRLNDPQWEQVEDIDIKDETVIYHADIVEKKDENHFVVQSSDPLKPDELVCLLIDNEECVYRIKTLDTTERGFSIFVEVADPMTYTDHMEMSGESDVDFSKVKVIEEQGDSTSAAPASFQIRNAALTKSGYRVNWNVGTQGFFADISKTLPHGEELYAQLQLNGIHIKYKWKSSEDLLQGAFFKITCHTQQDLGVRIDSYRALYGDVSKLEISDCIGSLREMFATMEKEPIEIPICRLQIPIEGTHMLTVNAQLVIRIHASGRAELTLSQDHEAGMEIRNGKLRLIQNFKHEEEAEIRANTSFTGAIKFAFDFLHKSLMNVGIETGAKAYIHSLFHLYKDDKKTMSEEDIPYDIAVEMLDGQPDVLVCADVNAYWILNVLLNTRGTVLNKIGFGKIFHLLGSENASIFPGGKVHLENFKVVDHCTRYDRDHIVPSMRPTQTDHIGIDAYAKAVHVGQTTKIQITALPSGYAKSDLVYRSTKNEVAIVDEHGTVKALEPGSAKIEIATKDGKYSVKCNILVPMEKAA